MLDISTSWRIYDIWRKSFLAAIIFMSWVAILPEFEDNSAIVDLDMQAPISTGMREYYLHSGNIYYMGKCPGYPVIHVRLAFINFLTFLSALESLLTGPLSCWVIAGSQGQGQIATKMGECAVYI